MGSSKKNIVSDTAVGAERCLHLSILRNPLEYQRVEINIHSFYTILYLRHFLFWENSNLSMS